MKWTFLNVNYLKSIEHQQTSCNNPHTKAIPARHHVTVQLKHKRLCPVNCEQCMHASSRFNLNPSQPCSFHEYFSCVGTYTSVRINVYMISPVQITSSITNGRCSLIRTTSRAVRKGISSATSASQAKGTLSRYPRKARRMRTTQKRKYCSQRFSYVQIFTGFIYK